MSLDKKTHEQIDDYLFGLMNKNESEKFEQSIQSNKELATAVAVQKLEQRTMQLLAKRDLKANLTEWKKEKTFVATSEKQEAKVVSFSQRVKKRRFFMYAAAASLVLLVTAFFGNQWAGQNYGSGTLAENSFSGTIGKERAIGTDNYPILIQPIISAMADNDYEKALQLLSQIKNPTYLETVKILQVECYFKLHQYESAIRISREVTGNGEDESNVEKAEWYLVLSYFAAKKSEVARSILNEILANPNHAFYPDAVELNDNLGSFWGRWVN